MKRINHRNRRKIKRATEALKRIWGPRWNFIGSTEGTEEENGLAEFIVHELAHQTLMPKSMIFPPGTMHMANNSGRVNIYIDKLRRRSADLHEAKALAIEFIVGKKLDLGLNRSRLIDTGYEQTTMCAYAKNANTARRGRKTFNRWIRIEQRSQLNKDRADQIIYLINRFRRKNDNHRWV